MEVIINYGDEELNLNFPDNIKFDIFEHKSVEKTIDPDEFGELLKVAENNLFPIQDTDLFVLNDAYRPTPTALILEWIDLLGKLNDYAGFIIATGTHRPPAENQLKMIFGDLYDRVKDRIRIHDAEDDGAMSEIGRDFFDKPVFLNKEFCQAERITVIGSVEPHYFAGFTGGRKSIFPGLCDYNTIARNHNMAADFDAAPMKLDGNPVHEHLQSLMTLLPEKLILSIQTIPVTGINKHLALVCGNLNDSFRRAAAISRKTFGIDSPEKYDILLAEVRPPLDSNLYQLQKSLENCQSAVRDGGLILLFSPCREGIGSQKFYDLVERWHPGLENELSAPEVFGIHKLSRVKKIGARIDIHLYSTLQDGISDKVFYKSNRNPQLLIDEYLKEVKEVNNLQVAFVRDSGHTTFAYN